MTDMNNRGGKNIFIGKTEQMTNNSSPSQVQVHQLIGKQMYHHGLIEDGIGSAFSFCCIKTVNVISDGCCYSLRKAEEEAH
jgi:hypothetical protein